MIAVGIGIAQMFGGVNSLPIALDQWVSPTAVISICEPTNAASLIDGNTVNSWQHAEVPPHEMVFDLGDRYLVSGARSYRSSQTGNYDVLHAWMYVSEDGVTWGDPVIDDGAIPDNGTGWMDYSPAPSPTPGRYVKMVLDGRNDTLVINEFEFLV